MAWIPPGKVAAIQGQAPQRSSEEAILLLWPSQESPTAPICVHLLVEAHTSVPLGLRGGIPPQLPGEEVSTALSGELVGWHRQWCDHLYQMQSAQPPNKGFG